MSEDPFFKKQLVKQPKQSDVRGKDNQFYENRYPRQHISLANPFVNSKPVGPKDDKTRNVVKSMVFVKKKTRNVVKSMVFVKKDVPESSIVHGMHNSSVKNFVKKNVNSPQKSTLVQAKQRVPIKGGQQSEVKLSKPQRIRRNKQLQKLLFQYDPSQNSGNDIGSCKESKNNELGNSKFVSQKSVITKVPSRQTWKPKDSGSRVNFIPDNLPRIDDNNDWAVKENY
ncbi:hypothetical protein L1987_45724 [Smallanthus sonchifolius]|uniref:Uncharacterized protein n=1 Tax=Smallanthus sonchifolius TaxID=185202 RepID=A0ACB9FXI8_9ASTR|nr:hypothetical protein L1987_45724 [Smallanthus sonchifolius]